MSNSRVTRGRNGDNTARYILWPLRSSSSILFVFVARLATTPEGVCWVVCHAIPLQPGVRRGGLCKPSSVTKRQAWGNWTMSWKTKRLFGGGLSGPMTRNRGGGGGFGLRGVEPRERLKMQLLIKASRERRVAL